jgi:hypothetical protein
MASGKATICNFGSAQYAERKRGVPRGVRFRGLSWLLLKLNGPKLERAERQQQRFETKTPRPTLKRDMNRTWKRPFEGPFSPIHSSHQSNNPRRMSVSRWIGWIPFPSTKGGTRVRSGFQNPPSPARGAPLRRPRIVHPQ